MNAPEVRRPRRRRRARRRRRLARCSTGSRPRRRAARCRRSGSPAGTIAEAIHRELARRGRRLRGRLVARRVLVGRRALRPGRLPRPQRARRRARRSSTTSPVDPANVHEVPASDEVATAEDAAAAYGEAVREHGAGVLRGADARHRPRRPLRLALPRPPGARRPRRDRRRRPRLPQAAARPGHPHLRGHGAQPRGVVPRQRRRARPRPSPARSPPTASVHETPARGVTRSRRPSGGSTRPPPPPSDRPGTSVRAAARRPGTPRGLQPVDRGSWRVTASERDVRRAGLGPTRGEAGGRDPPRRGP